MDEDARKLLYNQLLEMNKLNKKRNIHPILSREEFMNMPEKDVLKYVFDYRDMKTEFETDFYIKLPNIELHGIDLSGTYISKFKLTSENEKGEIILNVVDLGETNALINLNGLIPTDGNEKNVIYDLENVDFRGCNLFGILPDEYPIDSNFFKEIVVKGKEKLDQRYLKRRMECRLTIEEKKLADRTYERLLNGQSLSQMRGSNEKINLTDYDLSKIKDLDNLYKSFKKYNIEIHMNSLIALYKLGKKEFVGKYMNLFYAEKKVKLLMDVYNQSEKDIIDEYFYQLIADDKTKILKILTNQGKINYAKEHFREILEDDDKTKILRELSNHGEVDFVKEHFKDISRYNKAVVLVELSNQGEIDFVKEHFREIWDDDDKTEVFKSLINQGEIDFVKKNFTELNSNGRVEILTTLINQGEIDFVKEHFDKIRYNVDRYELSQKICKHEGKELNISKDEYVNGKMQEIIFQKLQQYDYIFVMEHFYEIKSECKAEVLGVLANQGEVEFVKKRFKELKYDDKVEVLLALSNQGNIDFVREYFWELNKEDTSKVLTPLCNQGITDFVEECFGKFDMSDVLKKINEDKLDMLTPFIKSCIEYENEKSDQQLNEEHSFVTNLLYEVLDSNNFNKELALKLIEIGDISERKKITFNSILYKVIEIEDVETRREIVDAMLNAGIDFNSNKVENNAKKSKIKKERESKKRLKRICTKEEGIVENFLRKNISLNQEEVENFKDKCKQYGVDIKNLSIEKLELKRKILEICDGTKEFFKNVINLIRIDEDILYARVMFFKEQGIKIGQENLKETMSLSQKQFAKKYGNVLGVIVDRNGVIDVKYLKEVESKLITSYPIPKIKDDFEKKLAEVNK